MCFLYENLILRFLSRLLFAMIFSYLIMKWRCIKLEKTGQLKSLITITKMTTEVN